MTTRASFSALTNAADALRAEEIRRTRALLRVGWVLAAAVVAAILIAPGQAWLAHALLAAVGVAALGSVAMYRELRDPERYQAARMTVLAVACVICGQLGILYVGAFSAAPLMVGLGLYFFCRTENLTTAIAIYATAAGAHAVEAALVIGGVVVDPGFYPVGHHASLPALIAGQLLLQTGYGLCFWLARVTRRSSLRSIEQLQKATRLAAQRDVQLAELRRDLDRALEVGGPGRFTGVTVGSWQLATVLGRGAMGEVYDATHLTTGAPAAVKVLRRELLADPRHVERFLREVRVAGAIASPHVVKVLDASTPTDTLPFLAMERLAGTTLSQLLRKGRGLDASALARLVTQTGSVLALAREAGIVHRDLKPQNLFLTVDDAWKVLDFGVALLADSSGTLTRGSAIGTPSYMAPEQARGDAVDHRADVYALGAVIYRCVTGRIPFTSRDTASLLYAVVHQMPLQPSTLASISPDLEAFLLVALAKDPAARFGSAQELVDAFLAVQAGRSSGELRRRAHALARIHPWRAPETHAGGRPAGGRGEHHGRIS